MGLLDGFFGKEAISQLKQQLADKVDELSQAESRIEDLQRTRTIIEGELKNIKIRFSEKEEALVLRNKELDESKSRNSKLAENLETIKHIAGKRASEADQRVATLEQELAKYGDEVTNAKDAYAAIQNELGRMRETYSAKDRLYQERENKLSEKSQNLIQVQQRIALLEANLQAREQHWKNDIEPKLKRYESHLSLDLRKKELDELQNGLERLRQSLQAREADMIRRSCDDESLKVRESKVAERNQVLSSRENDIAKSAKELLKQQSDQDVRSGKLEKWARELYVFQGRVNKLDSDMERLDALGREIEAKEKESLAQHSARLAEIRDQRSTLQQLTDVVNQRESALKIRENAVKGEAARIGDVKNKNLELGKKLNSLASAVKSLEKEKVQAGSEIQSLEGKNKKLQDRLAKLQKELRASVLTSMTESSLSNPTVLAWLLEDAGPNVTEIMNGWVGWTGYGPWGDQVLEATLVDVGYQFYQMPDADLEYLIVGRGGWSETELRAQIEVREGSPLRIYSQEMFFAKLVTGKDPFDSEDDDLLSAFAEDHPALQFLMSLPHPWPSVTSEDAIIDVDGEDFGVSESPLHILGYRVGATSDLSVSERRRILSECFESKRLTFSDDSDDAYIARWGRGGGAQRLYRMAWHIKSLVDGRSRSKLQARIDWMNDLKWLREKYFANYKSRFSWPGV